MPIVGVLYGHCPDQDIHNLSRFIFVLKNSRPLIWLNAHPYFLADRFLEITPLTNIGEDVNCDQTIALYGFFRVTNFPMEGARAHVPGVGGLSVSMIEALPEPCNKPFINQMIAGKKQGNPVSESWRKSNSFFMPQCQMSARFLWIKTWYVLTSRLQNSTTTSLKMKIEDWESGLGE